MSALNRDPLLSQGQAPPREKLFVKGATPGERNENMTTKRKQGSNLQFEASM